MLLFGTLNVYTLVYYIRRNNALIARKLWSCSACCPKVIRGIARPLLTKPRKFVQSARLAFHDVTLLLWYELTSVSTNVVAVCLNRIKNVYSATRTTEKRIIERYGATHKTTLNVHRFFLLRITRETVVPEKKRIISTDYIIFEKTR